MLKDNYLVSKSHCILIFRNLIVLNTLYLIRGSYLEVYIMGEFPGEQLLY